MKKNLILSLLSGFLLVATACGNANPASNTDINNSDVIAVGEDKTPLASEPDSGEASSEEPDELLDYYSNLDEIKPGEDGTISNGLFSVRMPEDTKDTYVAFSSKDAIYIYDKDAKEAGFGGFVFSISVYKEPKEYAGGMDKKVGEMTLSDGTVYDVVRDFPSDVQWDYTKSEEMPDSYKKLEDSFEELVKTLEPFDMGSFDYGAGTKGEDIYVSVIDEIRTALEEGYDATKLEEMGLSSMYFAIKQSGDDPLKKTGYAYMDINFDGVDELMVGEIIEGEMKGVVYDIFTVSDREPVHVLSGYARDRYFINDGGMIVNEASGGADITIWTLYDIEPNTTRLMPQYSLKYDSQEDSENPYFLNFDPESDSWENISEEDFNMYKDRLNYNHLDYTPFG